LERRTCDPGVAAAGVDVYRECLALYGDVYDVEDSAQQAGNGRNAVAMGAVVLLEGAEVGEAARAGGTFADGEVVFCLEVWRWRTER